jgi:hypothetical protein
MDDVLSSVTSERLDGEAVLSSYLFSKGGKFDSSWLPTFSSWYSYLLAVANALLLR